MSKQAYKVLERSFIHDRLYEPDETVVIDGPAGPNLQKLDGKEAAIRPAYSAFRSVYVEPGRHTLIFRYRPAGFALGASISLAGIALTLGCLAWPLRVAVLGESHRVLGWPARWPALVIVSIVFLIAVSAVSVHRDGSVGIQSRWRQSFHPFTWGAGIDAMRYQTKSP